MADSKPWYASKTLWVNFWSLMVTLVLHLTGYQIPMEYTALFLGAVNMLLRLVTKDRVTLALLLVFLLPSSLLVTGCETLETSARLKAGPLEVGAEVIPEPSFGFTLGICPLIGHWEWTRFACPAPPSDDSGAEGAPTVS